MSSALAQVEIWSILSRFVFSTHTFLLIGDFICLNQFTRDGASVSPKAVVLMKMKQNGIPKSPS